MGDLRLSGNNIFVISLILCLLIGLSVSKINQAKAQLPAISPPGQMSTPLHVEPGQLKNATQNDIGSPVIEVLTTSLIEGENVFKVRINDQSYITTAQVTFVRNGQFVTDGLIRDPNNVYKTLINAHLPSAVVITRAVDMHGKTTSVVKYLDVTPLSNSFFGKTINFFTSIGKSIVSIL